MERDFSIYRNVEGKSRCIALYETALTHWPVPYEQLDLATRFGTTHAIASGSETAPPIVLLHGQWTTATMWSSFFPELSRNHRVYAIDQIDDNGKSVPRRSLTSRLEYAQWVEDVFDQLELKQANLVGLSYGGFLAVNFGLYAPTRVRRLCLLCPGLPLLGTATRNWAIHGLPMTIFPSRLTARWLVQGMSAHGYRRDDPEAQQILAAVVGLRSRIPFRPVFAEAEFRNLDMPIQLLIGDKETMYDPAKAIARARQLIPHVEAELIPNAGHMLSTDQPELVVQRVLHFL